jgi:TonB family protein
MKTCPQCRREFEEKYNFCLTDGTPLVQATAETDPREEQETLVNFDPPPIGDETVMMDDQPSFGDETVMMNDQPPVDEETVLIDKAALTDEELSSAQKETARTPQSAVPTEEWQDQELFSGEPEDTPPPPPPGEDFSEEEEEEEGSFTGGQVFIDQNQASPESPPPPPKENPPEKSKSKLFLMLGALGLFLLLFVGVTIGGLYLYLQGQNGSNEIAAANSNQETNAGDENSDSGEINSNIALNENNDELSENTDLGSNSVSENDNNDAKPTPTKTRTPTPKPTATRTPTPKPTATRTPTPRPTRTPDNSPPPPPSPKPTPSPGPGRISRGVVNGSAISLPKPAYPAAARAVRASGAVRVQVIIGKSGNVISARAVSGHPLLRNAATRAARRARFRPTSLNGRPVEVSGVIVYNFRP